MFCFDDVLLYQLHLHQTAMRQIVDSIGLSAVGEELMSLWMEYEEGTCIGTDHGMHVVTLLLPSQLVLQYLGLFAHQRVFMYLSSICRNAGTTA